MGRCGVQYAGDDHRHCKVCGKPIDPGDEVCSRACRRQRETAMQSRRNLTYLLYGAMAFLAVLLVLTYVR